MAQFFRNKILPIFLIPTILLSCDGSAPGGNAIIPDNNLPVFTNASVVSVVENTTAVVTVQALDADGDAIVYSITGGNDQAAFSINSSTGDLAFLTAPDYETPGAAGGENSYVLIITADDDLSVVEQNILVSVTNADDNPPVASDLIVFDNNAGALVEGDTLVSNYVYSDADGDEQGATTLRWLRDGVEISGETASTYMVAAADVGEPVSFEITPVSTNGAVGTPVVSPTITTTNNAPVATSVVITGDSNGVAKLGDTLTGTYIYSDFESDIEGPTAFRWLRDGSSIAGVTVSSYNLVAADVGSVIRFEVTPFSNSGTSPGAVVLSAAVSVPNNAPTASPVTLVGNPYSGQILSGAYTYSDIEGDLDAGASTFRWLRDGVEIFGETLSTYLLRHPIDLGTTIKFEVIPKSATGVSPGVAVTSAGILVLNAAPTVASGDIEIHSLGVSTLLASFGDELTASQYYFDLESNPERVDGAGDPNSIYQWYRNGVAIPGATQLTYTLGSADKKDDRISVEITPIAVSGTIEGLPAHSTWFVTVLNDVPVVSNVSISGATGTNHADAGYVLTGSYDFNDTESDVDDASTFRWLRADNIAISGATNLSYTVGAGEIGQVIRLEVTPGSTDGSSPGLSTSSANITIDAAPVALPVISPAGTAVVTNTLTASIGYSDLENAPENGSTYRWLRDGVVITGETSAFYNVVAADVGTEITVEVVPHTNSGTSPGVAAVSLLGVTINNSVPFVVGTPTVSGTANVGELLTGVYSVDDNDGDTLTSSFRWLRDGVAISGATNDTYILANADSGSTITFEVTPAALTGLSPGIAVASAGISINELPLANTLLISGTATTGQVLTASYVFFDADDTQGTSTFRWLRNGAAISGETTTSYTVALEDVGELIQFEVTPISSAGSNPGIAVVSSGVTPTNVFTSNVVCTTNEYGAGNKLGVSRYWRFSATQTQAITILASQTSGTIAAATSNPDLYLYRQGVVVAQETADTSTSQTMITGVTAGDYVLELKEDYYVANAAPPSTACYDVSITYGGGFAKPSAPVEKPSGGEVFKSGPSSCSDVGEIRVTGTMTYDRVPHNAGTSGLDYASITPSPIRGAVVEVICGADGLVYDSGVTGVDGSYDLAASNAVNNYVRVKAQLLDVAAPGTWNFKVVDNTSGGALYVMDTTLFNSAGNVTGNDFTADSGWVVLDTAYTNPRVAAPFAILDSVYTAFNEVLTVDSNAVFPALNINWSTQNALVAGNKALGEITTSHYDPATGEIYILGDEGSDTDEYDQHVIVHEWAHYFEDNLSRTDSMGGAHTAGDILDMRLAFGEGFGNAYAGIAIGDPIYRDSSGVAQAAGFDFDMDTDVCANAGWYSECSVHELLYDFDTLLGGFGPLYSVLANEQKSTAAFTSIFSFVWELKVNNVPDVAAIDALVTGQSIDIITDIYGDSEVANNPGTTDQLPIYEQF